MKFIQSPSNPQAKEWRKLSTKKGRDRTGCYLIEGFHLVEEAMAYQEEIVELIVREGTVLPTAWAATDLPASEVSAEVARSISAAETDQGVFAVCRKRTAMQPSPEEKKFLLLDAVQDPGNIGTMIRTADAAGLDTVILGSGSGDLYNPKVIRSAQGSHFHLSIYQGDIAEWITACKEKSIPVYGTALENASIYTEAQPSDSFAIIVGNEGKGVSEHILSRTDQNLYIPIYGKSESLNVAVAAGILMYHLRK